jgi:thiol-disulfide isomerase/thioredoxin
MSAFFRFPLARGMIGMLLGLLAPLAAPAQGPPGAPPRELMQRLFNPQNSVEEMRDALKAGEEAGLPHQILLEAQLIWGLRLGETVFLSTLLPELEAMARTFDPSLAGGIGSVEELRGLIAFVKAKTALRQGDEAEFEKQIKEAFWLHPGSAPLFAQEVEKLRREKKMANFKLDLDIILTTSEGEATTLADQLGSNKALLLDFWASWCGPCMNLMPELRKKGRQLEGHGIVVAAMNTDSENAEAVADKVRREKDMTIPWLVEPVERPYSRALEIRSIPSMVLVTPDGKVLFFGHPQSPELWEALRKIDPTIQPPGA